MSSKSTQQTHHNNAPRGGDARKNARNERKRIGLETLEISRTGCYRNDSGDLIDLQSYIESSRNETVHYLPANHFEVSDEKLLAALNVAKGAASAQTIFEVRNQTTIQACYELYFEYLKNVDVKCNGATEDSSATSSTPHAHTIVGALNFASAKNPGGGVQSGAQAQEESLCRASALFRCIHASPGYAHNKRNANDALYSEHITHSPHVPIFRADDERATLAQQMDDVAFVSFVTSAAPNRGATKPHRKRECTPLLRLRIDRILALFALHGQRRLVLGAYGCGVFKNDPNIVAEIFHEFLHTKYKNVFEKVVFAVIGPDENRKPFESKFGVCL